MSLHTNQILLGCAHFAPQAECLRQPLVEAGANLVYMAPTSAGKSLVADVLMLQLLRTQPDKAVLMVGEHAMAAVVRAC